MAVVVVVVVVAAVAVALSLAATTDGRLCFHSNYTSVC